jgi:hypothetical protein
MYFILNLVNFIVSGLAVQWYTKSDENGCISFFRIVKNHFGSIVAGSFLNAFFGLFDFIFESLRCYPEGPCNACAACCKPIYDCFGNFLELIRTDVYAYINLTGIAYCEAARNCEKICNRNASYIGNRSILYFYRISSYIFTVGLTTLLCFWILKSKNGNLNFVSLIVIVILSYCILTNFVDIHANAAEGL